MQKIPEILQKTASIPGAVVDRNFLQERDVVRQQLELRGGSYSEKFVQDFISDVKGCIATLEQEVSSNSFPEDYKYFLEYCGGLSVENEAKYYFSTYGIGPLVEQNYASIDSDEAQPDFCWSRGLVRVGHLSFRSGNLKYHHVYFYLDLVGEIQKNCVFGVGPLRLGDNTSQNVIENLQLYTETWKIIADSFTEWLLSIYETKGLFGYDG